MSLINEALKKAQRQRSDQPPGSPGPMDRSNNGPKPMRAQSVILLVAGAAVLVVFSVVITVYLLNRNPVSVAAPLTATTAKAPAPTVDLASPSPVIVPPVIPTATPVATAPAETVAIAATPPVVSALPVATRPAAEVSTAAATVAAAPARQETTEALPPAVVRPTELEIQLFVDAIRVTGIKSSGGESKVLMNDRVYRVNDFVNRSLALKLVGVEPEKLTFSDASGTTYTKSF